MLFLFCTHSWDVHFGHNSSVLLQLPATEGNILWGHRKKRAECRCAPSHSCNRKLLSPRNSSSCEFVLPKWINWKIFRPVSWWGQFSCTPVPKSAVHRAWEKYYLGLKWLLCSVKIKCLMRLPSLHLWVIQTSDASRLKHPRKVPLTKKMAK